MILVSGGIKGGSGKSTIATNLAVIRAAQGRDVLLVDSDDQETATDFSGLRKSRDDAATLPRFTSIKLTGAAVRTEVLQLKGKYQDIIIDTGGRDTASQRAALSVADVLLAPFVPRSFDIWTIEQVAAVVSEMRQANPRLLAFTFINKADPVGSDNEDAAKELRDAPEGLEYLDMPIVARKAFGNAAGLGLAVTELKRSDPKATEEITRLERYVFDITKISQVYNRGA